jgi:hypothetical protein
MKLNGVQAQALFGIAFDSLRIGGEMGGLQTKERSDLVNAILNQQGQELVETGSDPRPTPFYVDNNNLPE